MGYYAIFEFKLLQNTPMKYPPKEPLKEALRYLVK